MNVPGGLFGLLIALMFGGPLACLSVLGPDLLILSNPQASPVITACVTVVVAFLTVYVYAVLSAFLLMFVMSGIALIVPTGFWRWFIYWMLAIAYLVLTGIYVVLAPSVAVGSFATLSQVGTSPPEIYCFAGLVIALTAPLQFVAVAIAYGLGASYAPPGNSFSNSELLWRGILAGLNAGANLLLGSLFAAALFAPFVSAPLMPGLVWGGFCGFVSLTASWMPTSGATVNLLVRIVLGWSSWLLPTSWLTLALGWLLFCLNLLSHVLLSLPFHPWAGMFTINEARIYGECGTMNTEGGICANLWPVFDTVRGPVGLGYDLGSFVFIHARTTWGAPWTPGGPSSIGLPPGSAINGGTTQHEAGHNLNLAAFGSLFHLVGSIQQVLRQVTDGSGRRAYSERLANSNDQGTPFPQLPFWRP